MTNETSKPIRVTCLECGRDAQVIDASRWACPHCTMIQPTAPRIVAECWTCRVWYPERGPLSPKNQNRAYGAARLTEWNAARHRTAGHKVDVARMPRWEDDMPYKAIVTKYHGPTDTRGSRIVASDGDGNRVSIPYPHELSGEAVHLKAAQALADKMKWGGKLIGGGLKDGYAFVFVD